MSNAQHPPFKIIGREREKEEDERRVLAVMTV
jgi:hypothetical protein